jgi:hypothetical protein
LAPPNAGWLQESAGPQRRSRACPSATRRAEPKRSAPTTYDPPAPTGRGRCRRRGASQGRLRGARPTSGRLPRLPDRAVRPPLAHERARRVAGASTKPQNIRYTTSTVLAMRRATSSRATQRLTGKGAADPDIWDFRLGGEAPPAASSPWLAPTTMCNGPSCWS